MKSPLALAVYHEGRHYAQRVMYFRTMRSVSYTAYLRGLLRDQATLEAAEFGTPYPTTFDIHNASEELYDAMALHVAETDAIAARDLAAARAAPPPPAPPATTTATPLAGGQREGSSVVFVMPSYRR